MGAKTGIIMSSTTSSNRNNHQRITATPPPKPASDGVQQSPHQDDRHPCPSHIAEHTRQPSAFPVSSRSPTPSQPPTQVTHNYSSPKIPPSSSTLFAARKVGASFLKASWLVGREGY
eukprot:Gregarina_sp_Poly_1__5203@NODE_2758_length_1751_cov_128_258314_g1740_i0_p2_GENE_NODE_2758_length_1751_cov_128_258314_g1740_i0NODE_2758_length_1751_cov_128_258314_g1740_i0_p2_ORF_typecomplete_len117_score2_82KAR9/PF08580_10/6_5_NODE_2758_length_1751_cov_128_258314_g1740_i013531703